MNGAPYREMPLPEPALVAMPRIQRTVGALHGVILFGIAALVLDACVHGELGGKPNVTVFACFAAATTLSTLAAVRIWRGSWRRHFHTMPTLPWLLWGAFSLGCYQGDVWRISGLLWLAVGCALVAVRVQLWRRRRFVPAGPPPAHAAPATRVATESASAASDDPSLETDGAVPAVAFPVSTRERRHG